MIEEAPLQAYLSAIVFAPTRSLIRQTFSYHIPPWFRQLPATPDEWSKDLLLLEGHRDSVHALAYSPDGQLLASASRDRTVRLWTTTIGAAFGVLEGHSDPVTAVAFSPDSRIVASAAPDGMLRLWDAKSGALGGVLEGHLAWVNALAFSPDGQRLASASYDQTVKLWDAKTGAFCGTLHGHSTSVKALFFSPDSKLLVSASQERRGTYKIRSSMAWVCNAQTGESCARLICKETIEAIAFLPDGVLLAATLHYKQGSIWDVKANEIQATFNGCSPFYQAVFSADGRILATLGAHREVVLWNTRTGAFLDKVRNLSDSVTAMTFAPDGRNLALASTDYVIRTWGSHSGSSCDGGQETQNAVRAEELSPRSPLMRFACAADQERRGIVQVYAPSGAIDSVPNSVRAVVAVPERHLLVYLTVDGGAAIWPLEIGASFRSVERRLLQYPMAISADNQQFAYVRMRQGTGLLPKRSNSIMLWSVGVAAARSRILSGASTMTFSATGQLIAVSTGRNVFLCDTTTGSLKSSMWGEYEEQVHQLVFSAHDDFLAAASSTQVDIWNIRTASLHASLHGHFSTVSAIAFSPDSMLLGVADAGSSNALWKTEDGCLFGVLDKGADQVINELLFSPDGKVLAGASDQSVLLWDVTSCALFGTLERHLLEVKQVFLPPGGRLLTRRSGSSHSRTYKLSCLTSDAEEVANQWIYPLCFSPDGQQLCMLASDGSYYETNISEYLIAGSEAAAAAAPAHPNASHRFTLQDKWLSCDGKKLLWLPHEYRPTVAAMKGDTVALALKSKRVVFMTITK
jgi:WD40 repeat protein